LRFAYGRASAAAVKAVTPELHTQLVQERARMTPAERQRHPRVVSLRVVGIMPGFAAATALGGPTTRVQPGDPVYGVVLPPAGSHAQYVVAPIDARSCPGRPFARTW
jgi:hypothetical protein